MDDTNAADQGGGRRGRGASGGAAARRAARGGSGPGTSLTYIRRQIPLYEVLSEEGIALIEANADTVLEEIGIDFREDQEALDLWKAAGADVRGERVHFPKGMRATRSARSRLAAMPRSLLPSTARPSCVISTATAATLRSRTSAIS
jgi:trimethylamine:corrinoid methyltransferase-like protein